MKKGISIYYLCCIIVPLFYSCEYDSIDDPHFDENFIHAEVITLHSQKKALYDSAGNRYVSKVFTQEEFSHTFEMYLESGIEYRVLVTGINGELLEMNLYDGQYTGVAEGIQADVGNTREILNFTCNVTGTFYLLLEYDMPLNELSIDYKLSIEEVGTYFVSWKNKMWQCDGDWEVNESGNLQFIGYESFYNKWVRICEPLDSSSGIELTFLYPNMESSNFIGVMANSSTEIFNVINLPEIGEQLKLKVNGEWEYWSIDINGSGVSRQVGTSTLVKSLENKILLTVADNQLKYSINDSSIVTVGSGNMYSCYYITVEDTERDTLIFKDFAIRN